jgi:hypothetical protein
MKLVPKRVVAAMVAGVVAAMEAVAGVGDAVVVAEDIKA